MEKVLCWYCWGEFEIDERPDEGSILSMKCPRCGNRVYIDGSLGRLDGRRGREDKGKESEDVRIESKETVEGS